MTRLPVPLRFPRIIGKLRTPDKLHGCAVCVNGKPVPITAKRTRETHETALQLRRLGKLKLIFCIFYKKIELLKFFL